MLAIIREVNVQRSDGIHRNFSSFKKMFASSNKYDKANIPIMRT